MRVKNTASLFVASLSIVGSVWLASGCAHVEVKPKDPQLLEFQQFAEKVAGELYDKSPSTYMQNQKDLAKEIAPAALKKLQAQGLCAKSNADARAKMKAQKSEGVFTIDESSFLKATSDGLVPIEVKGTFSSSTHKQKFDIILLVGLNKKSGDPIVSDVDAH